MMISPIMAGGIVAQTQNVNLINNGEESRSQINYQHSQVSVDNQREEAHTTVVNSQESDKSDTRHDAREEGRNKYFDNRNKEKKEKPSPDGFVVKKKGGGFDVSV